MEWISTAEAATRLDVSQRQVRRLAADGTLVALLVGDRWLIKAAAVRDRARADPHAGRPLSTQMAWEVLAALAAGFADERSGDPFEGVGDRRVRHRLRRILADAPPPEKWHRWLRRRAHPQRVWIHPGVLQRLSSDPRLHRGGEPAEGAAGAGLAAGHRDVFYVDAADADAVMADYRARPDDDGQVVLMVVPSEAPEGALGGHGMPVSRVVGLVDLLGSPDARERHGAANALSNAWHRIAAAADERPTP
jgi:excisionase family DNA binding protein